MTDIIFVMPLRTAVLVFSALLTFGIVYPVLKSKRRDTVALAFMLLVSSLTIWIASSYLVDFIQDTTLGWNKSMAVTASIFGGLSIVASTWLASLLAGLKKIKWFNYLLIISSLLIIVGSIIPNSILAVERKSSSSVAVIYGMANYVWVLGVVCSVVVLLWVILKSTSKKSKTRDLMKVVSIGIFMAVMLGLTTNLIYPLITGNYLSAQFAPLVASVIAVSFGYAIVTQSLFDLRTSVFRAVGYALSIATLVGIYSIVVYGIIVPVLYPKSKFELLSFILVALGISSTLFFFNKIKVVFDAITDKLFFKNNYNLPRFLDEFNQALINSSDVGDLASSIFKVMGDNIKTEFFVLVVKHGGFEITIDSRKKESISEADAKLPLSLINYHFKNSNRVVFTDFMNKEKFSGLHEQLIEIDASAAIDLSEGSRSSGSLKKTLASGDFKALYLGPKRSGESYNSQDLDALRIISKELVIGLQNAMRFEEIKLFNIELQHKVDLATGKLRDQNKKLVLADELKDDFLSIASHQMRTPISAINGYASILNSGDAGKLNKNQQKFAKIIEESTRKLSYLINDFLTVSRLKSGKFNIDKTDTNLKTLLKGEVDGINAQYKAKGVSLKVSIDEKIPIIKADESKIRQVMMNLIDNALYYTPVEGTVDVSLKKTTGGIVFEVKDSGIGVPKDDQPKLFAKMYRASNAQKVRPDGTGLGLYLAKKVILGHQGHIIFSSVEGKGSTFGFRIPSR